MIDELRERIEHESLAIHERTGQLRRRLVTQDDLLSMGRESGTVSREDEMPKNSTTISGVIVCIKLGDTADIAKQGRALLRISKM